MGFSFHPISFFALLGLPFVGCILHFYLGFPEWISAIALVCGVYPFIHKSRERDSSNTPKYQEQVSASGLVLVSMCVTDMEPETNDVCTQKRSNQHSTKPYKQKIHVSASPAKTMKQKLLALRKLQQVQSRERCGKKTSASLEVPSNLASQSSSSEGSESNSLPIDVTLSKSEVTSMGAEIANQSSFAVSEPTKPMPENSPELMPSLTSNSFLCQPNRPLTAARNSEFRNQSPSTIPESTITMAERVTESNDMLSKDGDQK